MTSQNDRLGAIVRRRTRLAEELARSEALVRRRAMSVEDLNGVVEAAWHPIEERLINAVAEWNEALAATSATIIYEGRDGATRPIVRSAMLTFVDNLRSDVKQHSLRINVVAQPEATLAFSGPNGQAINGASGQIPLFDGDVAARIVAEAMRWLEFCADQSTGGGTVRTQPSRLV